MPILSLEYVLILFLLLVIAAALDLWFIRAWKRSRARRVRNGGKAPAAHSKADRRAMQKSPAASGTGTAVPPLANPGASGKRYRNGKFHQVEVVALKKESRKSAGKRGEKAAAPHATLSVPGKSGRLAHVDISMDLPEGESIRLTLESVGGGKALPASSIVGGAAEAKHAALPAWTPGSWGKSIGDALASFTAEIRTSGRSLFILALILYLATRLIGLAEWPIYFFTDEAVQTNFAAGFLENGFRGNDGELFPVFFENAGQYEMNLSVYVQLIPYLIFGKSVFVTRAVSVLITLLGMAAVGWILRRAFRLPMWWSGVLLLSIVPVWFLHSRTAFEPGESIAFYALFLYFYMRYREDSPWMLLPALIVGALAGYTYSPSQVMVAVTGALLLISDARYHWRHKWIALAGLGVLLFMSIPYLWFLHLHPDANRDQLAIVGSYWLNDISFLDKLKHFAGQYLNGLDPRYWFLADPPEGVHHDIIRHLMKGYGHLSLWSLPFAAVGILLCLGNIRHSRFRTVLIALLAAPTGGAVAQITISRTLVTVIPASLLIALGVSWLLALLERPEVPPQPEFLLWWKERAARAAAVWKALRESLSMRAAYSGFKDFLHGWGERAAEIAAAAPVAGRIPRVALALMLFLVLGSANMYMLWDSLANGPTWYESYELYGMQYGGQQLCAALEDYKEAHPEANLIVSSAWANGTDEIFRFFLPKDFPMRTGTVLEYIQNYIPIGEQDVFIMTSEEYGVAQASGKFSEIRIEQILNYPNGQPGFYFARLMYVPDIEELIRAEKTELSKPVEDRIVLGGEDIRVVHSRFDMGELGAGFDGNPFSLMRSQQDNPLYLEMYFPAVHRFTRVSVRVGGAPTRLTVTFHPPAGGDPAVLSAMVERASDYRDVEILPDAPVDSSHIRVEIETVGEGEPTHVHVYEIVLEAEGWKSGILAPSP
ncbi:MAG: glycosyltransferase family 39 protein [Anaerolineales bacterium]|nr:glycosyltransferase family 39 protein [Anaerolineales bacterium]